MTEDDFLRERVDDQIKRYDRKNKWNQKYYKRLRITETMAAVAIPLLTDYITPVRTFMKVVVGFLGFLIAVINAIDSRLYHFQENWIEYRTTCESFRHADKAPG